MHFPYLLALQNNIASEPVPAPRPSNPCAVEHLAPCFSCRNSPFKLGCIHSRVNVVHSTATVEFSDGTRRHYCLHDADIDAVLGALGSRCRLITKGSTDLFGYSDHYLALGRGLGGSAKRASPMQKKTKKQQPRKPASSAAKKSLKLRTVPTQHAARSSDTAQHAVLKGVDSIDAKFSLQLGTYSVPAVAGSVLASGRLQATELALIAAAQQGPGNMFTAQVMNHSAYSISEMHAEIDLSGIPSLSSGEMAFISSEVPLDQLSPTQMIAFVNMRLSVRPPMVQKIKLRNGKTRVPVFYIAGAHLVRATTQEELDTNNAGFWYLIVYLPCQTAPVATSSGSAGAIAPVAVPKAVTIALTGHVTLMSRTLPSAFRGVTSRTLTVTTQTERGSPIGTTAGTVAVGELSFALPSSVMPAYLATTPTHRFRMSNTLDPEQLDIVDGVCTVVSVVSSSFGFPEAAPVLCMIVKGVAWLCDWVSGGSTPSAREKRARQEGAIRARDATVDRSSLENDVFDELSTSALSDRDTSNSFPPPLKPAVTQMLSAYGSAASAMYREAANQFNTLVSNGFVPFVIEHNYQGPGAQTNAPVAPTANVRLYTNSDGTLVTVSEPPASPAYVMPPNTYVSGGISEYPSPGVSTSLVPAESTVVPVDRPKFFSHVLMAPNGEIAVYKFNYIDEQFERVNMSPAAIAAAFAANGGSVYNYAPTLPWSWTPSVCIRADQHLNIAALVDLDAFPAPATITSADLLPTDSVAYQSHLFRGLWAFGEVSSTTVGGFAGPVSVVPDTVVYEVFSELPSDSAIPMGSGVAIAARTSLSGSYLFRMEWNSYNEPTGIDEIESTAPGPLAPTSTKAPFRLQPSSAYESFKDADESKFTRRLKATLEMQRLASK